MSNAGKFRALTVTKPGTFRVDQYDIPDPSSKDVLVKIEMTGVCGTDPHIIYDKKPIPWMTASFYPFIPGHEFIARIEKMGPDFDKIDVEGIPLKVGDLVAVCVDDADSVPCGKCYYCATGFPVFCTTRIQKEYPILKKGWQRSWAEFRYTHRAEAIYKISEEISLEAAVLIEPLSIAVSAFGRASMGASWLYQGMGPGKTVVIQGSGPIGVLLTATSKICGAGKTIVIGAPDNRLALCKEFGADEVISIEKFKESEERMSAIKELTPFGQGADVVFEAAGVTGAFGEGIQMIRDKGTFIELGHFTDRGPEPVNPFLLCSKNINLLGVYGGLPPDFLWAKKLLEQYHAKIPFEKLVTHKFPLEETEQALGAMRNMESMKTVLVP
jgi:threonine dehydrogenase-like Zn-dependent dehydrogenase